MNHCTKCGNNVPARCHTCEEAGFDPAVCSSKSPTQQFREDAEKGGWDGTKAAPDHYSMFLDPLAWQAVGKTREWYVFMDCTCRHPESYTGTCTMSQWHLFIDHRADGKTIDEALAAISQGV